MKASYRRTERGKVEFTPSSQMFINMTADTANIGYVYREIKKHWGKHFYVVSNDGISIEDSPSTQGK